MPSQSKSQQRLMGVAYAVKNGDMQLSDVDSNYRDKIKELVDSMSLKDLKDFAETKHDKLPEEISERVGGGVVKADIKRMLTKISGAIGYKHDPNMRQELLSAFEEDLKEILVKHNYVVESEDHEVGMAMGQLSAIHESATELEEKIGNEEKDLPGWIQSHITSAYEYLKQANDNFHELEESTLTHVTPNNIGGMGPITLPGVDNVGSGDVPAGVGSAKDRYEEEEDKRKKKNKKKKLLEYSEFIEEQKQEKPFAPEQPKSERLGEEDYEPGNANDPDEEMRERAKAYNRAKNIVTFKEYRSI
jgi:hypothetical protein